MERPEKRTIHGTQGLSTERKCEVCGTWKKMALTMLRLGAGKTQWACRSCMGSPSIERRPDTSCTKTGR